MKDKSLHVLIVEDSEDDTLLIIRNLKKGGYNPVYERVETAAAMKKALKEKQWDIILCDYTLPKFNAPSAIAILKEADIDIPIIIVSGAIGEETAVEFMRLSAHDYIMKSQLSRLCPAVARELEDAEVRNKEKQAEEKLHHEEQRFQAFVEHSSDIIIIMNREGIITYINPAVERILGFKPDERIGGKGFELIHPDDLKFFTDSFNTLVWDTNFPVIQGEMRLRRKDGSLRTFEAVGSNMVNNNVVEAVIINCRDITERKQVEEKLRESEADYRQLFDNSPAAIYRIDYKNGRFLKANNIFCEYLGYRQEELISLSPYDVLTEESKKLFSERMEKIAMGEEVPKTVEFEVIDSRGKQRCLQLDIRNIYDTKGHLVAADVVANDIPERKKAEEEALKSERRYREFFSTSRDCVFITSMEGKWIDFNDAALEMFGYDSREELFQVPISSLYIKPEKRSLFLALIEKQGYVKEHPVRLRRRDGAIIDTLITAGFRQDADGSNREYFGTIRDITERKRAEEALARSEENFHKEHKFNKLLFDTSPALIVAMSTKGEVLMMNQTLLDVLEYSIDEVKGVDYLTTFVPEEDRGTLTTIFQQIVRKEKVTINENRIRSKSGKIYLIEWHGRPMIHEGGDVDFFVGVGIDITERKQMEDSLLKSEENFRRSLDDSPLGVRISTIESETIYANRAVLNIYGYDSIEELKKTPLKERYTADSYAEFQLRKEKRLRGEFGPSEYEISIVRKNGEIRHLHVLRKEIFWNGKKQSQVVYQDITERKRMEDELRQNEEKYRSILETIQEGYFEVDFAGNFTFFNDSLCRALGYSKEELMGMNNRQYTDKENAKKLFQTFNKVYYSREPTEGFDWQVVRKDGTKRYVESSVSLQKDSSGKPIGFRGMVRDVTERKKAEEELQKTLESLRKAVGATIQVMVSAVEMRDPYTAGHQIRVADLARTIATEMGLPQDKIDGIRMAGSIHDIGKLSIPAEILSRPTKLTNLEFALIKEHSQIGYEMLKGVESPWPLAQIVYQHHERMDGSGYPRNLKGDEIIMEARIMAVADVVEAMGSHRPYRPTLGMNAALEEITKNKGILYDNAVVDTCLKLFREKGYRLK